MGIVLGRPLAFRRWVGGGGGYYNLLRSNQAGVLLLGRHESKTRSLNSVPKFLKMSTK